MESKLAQYIEQQATKWKQQLQCLSISGQSLLEQAQALQSEDTKSLLLLGKIPEKAKLAPHLRLNIEFNPFLAEPLLREGSMLLDRCLAQRKEYEELKTKFFEACIQVQELVELNRITKEEEATYQTSVEIAQFELNSLQKEQAKTEDAIKILEKGLLERGMTVTGPVEQINLIVDPDFDKNITLIESQTFHLANAGEWALTNQASSSIKDSAKLKIIGDYPRLSETFRGIREKSALEIQLTQLKGTFESLTERINASTTQIELKKKQLEFQIKRNDVARFVALRRAEQLALPDGALNYREQMQSVRERLQNDLVAAWLRLTMAAKGFEMLYDYFAFEERSKLFSKADFNTESYVRDFDFDDLVTWTQVTNTWLASFLDTQQQVTRSFSLKQLLAEQGGDFNAGLSSGKWRFKLKENHFSNTKLVRLRAFSIQIDSGHERGSWNIAISPPSKAILRVNESKIKPLEQKVGTLYLGRVNETTYQVIPESAAPPKLFNASPIGEDSLSGEWGVEIIGLSTWEKPHSSIQDIDIHLTVALV